MKSPEIDPAMREKLEAATFRRLLDHLRDRTDVQNIDLMNLAYFCRNCFAKWYVSAASDQDIELDYDQAREIVYGMPFSEYKSTYQGKASEEQLTKFEDSQKKATE